MTAASGHPDCGQQFEETMQAECQPRWPIQFYHAFGDWSGDVSGRPDWGQHYWIRALAANHGARQPGRPLKLYHTFGDRSGDDDYQWPLQLPPTLQNRRGSLVNVPLQSERPGRFYHKARDWSGDASGHPDCRRHLCETVRCRRDQPGRPEECYHRFETVANSRLGRLKVGRPPHRLIRGDKKVLSGWSRLNRAVESCMALWGGFIVWARNKNTPLPRQVLFCKPFPPI